MIWAVNAIIL